MFYFIFLFFCLVIYKRKLPIFHSLIISLALFPAIIYLVSLSGGKIFHNIYLDGIAVIIFSVFILYKLIVLTGYIYKSGKDQIVILVLPICFFIGFAFLYHKTFLLPGLDPIHVPSFAKLIYKAGCLPKSLSPLSDQPFTYPPGYSIFLSIFYNFKNPLFVLQIFKYLNIIVVSLTPAVWAFYFRKVYHLNFIKSHIILISFYCGFLLIDRTLPLALTFAGKNAVLYSFFIFPAVFYSFLKENNTVFDKTIAVLSVLGMILIHYSFLFMFSTLLFIHVLVNINYFKKDLIKLGLLFFCSILLFIPFYLHLKGSIFMSIDMPDASWNKALLFLKAAFFSLSDSKSAYLFGIDGFGDSGLQWNYKKILILLFILTSVAYFGIKKYMVKQKISMEEISIFKAILVSFGAVIFCIFLTSFLFFKPIFHFEYIKWFIYNFNALFISVSLIFLCYLTSRIISNNFSEKAIIAIIFLIPIVHYSYVNDPRGIYKIVNFLKVSQKEMKDVQEVLNNLSKDRPANLLTESRVAKGMGWNLTIQNCKYLEYYAVISECSILNGSWLTLPLEKSREIFNLPSEEFYRSKDIYPIYFIGKKEKLKNYLNKLENISAQKTDYNIGENLVYRICINE